MLTSLCIISKILQFGFIGGTNLALNCDFGNKFPGLYGFMCLLLST